MTTPKLQDPALTDVLAALHGRLRLERWIVTRCEGEELIVVASHGESLDIEVGHRILWPETICARVASQDGPRAAPDLAGVPAYADAPVAVRLGLRAYLGVPIWSGDRVLGTLVGIDRKPQGPTWSTPCRSSSSARVSSAACGTPSSTPAPIP